MLTEHDRTRTAAPAVEVPAPDRRMGVVVWATLGAAWAVFAVSGIARWLLSSTENRPVPRGADHISDGALLGHRVIEAVSMIALAALVWFFLVKPWRRAGRLQLDGMLLIAALFAFYIDPVVNQFRYTFAWSAYAYNRGSWAASLPGFRGSTRFAEGLLWAPAQYVYMGLGGAVLGCWLIGQLRRRSPGMSNVSAFAVVAAIYWVLDFALENLFIRMDMYSYARTWKVATLWSGSQYQWPLYEGLCVAAYALAFTYVRLQALDHGVTSVDRGLARLRIGDRGARITRLAAYIGFAPMAAFLGWFGPWSWLSVNADSIARLPSYLLPH